MNTTVLEIRACSKSADVKEQILNKIGTQYMEHKRNYDYAFFPLEFVRFMNAVSPIADECLAAGYTEISLKEHPEQYERLLDVRKHGELVKTYILRPAKNLSGRETGDYIVEVDEW